MSTIHRLVATGASRYRSSFRSLALATSAALIFASRFAAAQESGSATSTTTDDSGNAAETAGAAPNDGATTTGTDATATVATSRPGAASPDHALDLCALKPGESKTRYQYQRVLFMNPLVAAGMDAAEVEQDDKGITVGTYETLKGIKAGELLRLIVAKQFPMQRLYTVYSPAVATDALLAKHDLSSADLADVTGGDSFATYSAACADWVAVPRITRTGATWRKVKKTKTVVDKNGSHSVEYMAWDLSVGVKVEVALFKRSGSGFTQYKVLDSAGFGGIFANGAAAEPRTIAFHQYASTWPDSSCQIGTPSDGHPGAIVSCPAVDPKLSTELDGDVTASSSCAGVDDSVGAPMDRIARCAVTSSGEAALKMVQLHAKEDPWGMFTELKPEVRMAIGAREGAKRGDWYLATPTDAKESTAFLRVVRLGPGGDDGDANPSQLKFRGGDAPVGSRLKEYPLLGVHLGVRPAVMFLAKKGKLDTNLGYGGSATVAYDLSSAISIFDEFWIRGDVGYLRGSSNEGFFLVDAGPEGVHYLGGGLAVVYDLAFSALVADKSVNVAGQNQTWSGVSAGAAARLGLDYAFSPQWDLALAAEGRTGFSSAKLKNDKAPGTIVDAGSLLGAVGLLTVGHTL